MYILSRSCKAIYMQASIYMVRGLRHRRNRVSHKSRAIHAPARRLARTIISLGEDEGIIFGLRALRYHSTFVVRPEEISDVVLYYIVFSSSKSSFYYIKFKGSKLRKCNCNLCEVFNISVQGLICSLSSHVTQAWENCIDLHGSHASILLHSKSALVLLVGGLSEPDLVTESCFRLTSICNEGFGISKCLVVVQRVTTRMILNLVCFGAWWT